MRVIRYDGLLSDPHYEGNIIVCWFGTQGEYGIKRFKKSRCAIKWYKKIMAETLKGYYFEWYIAA